MTEEQIERAVERRTDAHDRALMRGDIGQADYDALMQELADWSAEQLKKVSRPY
jgi:hypothetical protein